MLCTHEAYDLRQKKNNNKVYSKKVQIKDIKH